MGSIFDMYCVEMVEYSRQEESTSVPKRRINGYGGHLCISLESL
jgi:hypothetical protein